MRINRELFFTAAAVLTILLFPLQLSAEGITILKQNMQTVLLIDGSYGAPSPGIELELIGGGRLNLTDGENSADFRFSTGRKAEKIYLYKELTGLFPEKIYISDTDGEFDFLSARIITEYPEKGIKPADIGHIIFSDFNPPKGTGWNVYSWNLVPEVLIYDTADYRTQARIFKRLAFFVEKPGYIGRLLENSELEGKHGWNAHDYRPEDLADFFSLADETGFILNNEELELRKLLVNHGIIMTNGDTPAYSAGTGAVLSVSRETLPDWRYRFLTHECLHGLFFTDPGYRADMTRAFSTLQQEEIEFWKHLLDYRQYDVENDYLLVNEYMAYTLQQPPEETDEYFKGFLYTRMIAARPYESGFVENFERNFSDSFVTSVFNLENILYSYTGRTSGHLANLYPAELRDSFFDLFPPL